MNEEELKQIEARLNRNGCIGLNRNTALWLITEVKRLKEIEDIIPTLELENQFVRARNERLEQENERLEKALEHYVRNAQEDIA